MSLSSGNLQEPLSTFVTALLFLRGEPVEAALRDTRSSLNNRATRVTVGTGTR